MTLTIGRVAFTQDPSEISYSGDSLQVAGWFFGTTLAHATVIRQQMLGLDGNDDEPEVPVTWTGDTDFDGYYTVDSVAVSAVLGVSYEQLGFKYSMQLERVQGGFASPICEVATSVALRTNGHAVTIPNGRTGLPSASTFTAGRYGSGVYTIAYSTTLVRASATGDVTLYAAVPTRGSFLALTYATLPADHYDGSAMIEQSVGGVWYPVVGDQIGRVAGNSLRIGNGLIRITFHTDGVISSELWDGTVWESATSFNITAPSSGTWMAEGGWRIIRNDPSSCAIQTSIAVSVAAVDYFPRTVTISLERGAMLAHFAVDGLYYDYGSPWDEALDMRAVTNTASTSLTGGIRQTSDNPQGHRWMMMCASAVTKDLVNGRLTIAAPGATLVGQFGLGWERDGSTSASVYDAVEIADNFFVALGMRQRVVARWPSPNI
jgi:hypothetical protein